ncbi:hypothetical protein [Paenimyroides ceti]
MHFFHKPVESILLVLFLMTFFPAKAQEKEKNETSYHINVISDENVTPPYYQTGINKFYEYVYTHLKYGHVSEFISDIVIVKFSIDTDGKVTDVEIVKDVDKSNFKFGKQIKKILLKSPTWVPGKIDGIVSKTSIQLPILIKVKRSDYIDDDL